MDGGRSHLSVELQELSAEDGGVLGLTVAVEAADVLERLLDELVDGWRVTVASVAGPGCSALDLGERPGLVREQEDPFSDGGQEIGHAREEAAAADAVLDRAGDGVEREVTQKPPIEVIRREGDGVTGVGDSEIVEKIIQVGLQDSTFSQWSDALRQPPGFVYPDTCEDVPRC